MKEQNKSQQQLINEMGNIQDVQEYQRVPIFGRSRSRTPRRITSKNNSPYHRQKMSKSVNYPSSRHQLKTCRTSQCQDHRNALYSVIKYGNHYENKQQLRRESVLRIANRDNNQDYRLKRQLSFDVTSWGNSQNQTRLTPTSGCQQLPFKKLSSPSATDYRKVPFKDSRSFISHSQSKLNSNSNITQNVNSSSSDICQHCHGMKINSINFQTEQEEKDIKTQRKQYNKQEILIQNQKNNITSMQRKQYTNFYGEPDDRNISQQNQEQFGFNQHKNSRICAQNRQRCEDIIRKVRNFNDFLNEVKRKLKNNIQKQIGDEGNHHSSIGGESSRSMVMSIKLESQKMQLQKYRKLVNRELSKQHSIESIQIENGRSQNEKLIKINYDSISKKNQRQSCLEEKKFENLPHSSIVKNSQNLQNFAKQNRPKYTQFSKVKIKQSQPLKVVQHSENSRNSEQYGEKNNKKITQSRIKQKYEQAVKKMDELGKILGKQQVNLNQRMSNINSLMGHLEGVNQVQEKSCKELSKILHKKDFQLASYQKQVQYGGDCESSLEY